MRRRKKPVTNDSESTGKIGHEIPQDQPTPLQPSYPQALEHEDTAKVSARASHVPHGLREDDEAPAAAAALAANGAGRDRRNEPGQRQNGRSGNSSRNRGRNRNRNRNRSEGRVHAATPSSDVDVEPMDAADVPESQADSLPAAETGAARTPHGYVVLAIGLPGSGKTTWFKRRGVTPLSSDMLRSILFDDAAEQRFQGLVFSTLRSLLRARLIAKMPWNYVDATNLSPHERRQWIKMAHSFGYEVHAVFFDVPFDVCKERNMRRDRRLTEEDMAKMQERLRPPSFKEGFHKITVVRVKSSAGPLPDVFDPQN